MLSFVLLALLSGSPQQLHPCDVAVLPNESTTSPVKIGFCWDGNGTDGKPQTATLFKVYIGTSTTPVYSGLLQPIGSPSASGMKYYETPSFSVPTGAQTLRVTISSSQGEGAAASYPFTVVVIKPSSPFGIRIVQ